jgi:hypothetical protein
MSLSILFWGFKNTSLLSECLNKIKQHNEHHKFYIQISPQQKTSSFINLYPEEMIRSETSNLNNICAWVEKTLEVDPDPMVIIDTWSLLEVPHTDWLDGLKRLIQKKSYFIFIAPNLSSISSKKIGSSYKNTEKFFVYSKKIYEYILNSKSDAIIVSLPPPEYLMDLENEKNIFHPEKICHINFLPKVVHSFSFIFQTKKGISDQILGAYKHFYEKKYGSREAVLQGLSRGSMGELLNENFIFPLKKENKYQDIFINEKKRYKKMFIFPTSLDFFYKKIKRKDEILFILWLLHLGIIEYEDMPSHTQPVA